MQGGKKWLAGAGTVKLNEEGTPDIDKEDERQGSEENEVRAIKSKSKIVLLSRLWKEKKVFYFGGVYIIRKKMNV